MSKCELLSPAGDFKSLEEAIKYGADAVYVGGSAFSARANAINFNDEELLKATDYCHINNVKIFVACNILVADKEFFELDKYILYINKIGVDGVIVQDLGVAKRIKEIAPDLPLHASTQMTVCDINGVNLLKNLGFKRVVLARELSIKEICDIVSQTDVEIEIFVHGAICVCYSGQCLMSSFIGGRSGNRGKCAQPCRQLYKMGNEKGFLLSPKDMCLINHLEKIKKSGVVSLKVEGRMKGASYVSSIISVYRKYLDNNKKVTDEDYNILNSVFYRGGFTDGYLTGKTGEKMFCTNKPDNPYLKQNNKIVLEEPNRKTKINFKFILKTNEPLMLTAYNDNISATVLGETNSERAINVPLSEERALNQLSKLGGTNYYLGKTEIIIDENITIPISEINNARRNVISLLESKIIEKYKRENGKIIENNIKPSNKPDEFKINAFVRNIEQLKEIRKTNVFNIYVPLEFYDSSYEREIAVLPRINNENLISRIKQKNVKRALVRNIGQVQILKEANIEFYVDSTLNIYNTNAFSEYEKFGASRITLSNELTLNQIYGLNKTLPTESVIYGKIAVMVTKNCLIKSTGKKCSNKKGSVLTDKTGAKFKIMCLENCNGNEIFNSCPVNMSSKLNDVINSNINFGRLNFTDEEPKMCRKIAEAFLNGEATENGEFTRGKFYKGV